MKKAGLFVSLVLLAVVLLWSFASANLVGDGNLACDDFLGCRGAASCNTSGDPDGCNLNCKDGAVVVCNSE